MIMAAAVWLVLCAGFAAAGPRLAAAVRPDVALRLLVGAAVALSAAGVFVLGSAAATWAAQDPQLAALDRLNPGELHATSPISPVAAALASLLLAAAAVSLTVTAWRGTIAHRALRAAVARAESDDVIVLGDERIDAFVTPGRHGRVVVTTGLLGGLEPAEREALLAHERAHRRQAHAWWRLTMRLTVAVNPLLRPVRRAADHAMERSADEEAADQVGDRRLVARTVARVALLKKHGTTASIGLALSAHGGDIPARVRALLKPASPRGRVAAGALFVFLAGAVAAAVFMQRTTDGLFDAAHVR
jgi:beta-lactamase regulating signal transducer with metallopeptidase domain